MLILVEQFFMYLIMQFVIKNISLIYAAPAHHVLNAVSRIAH